MGLFFTLAVIMLAVLIGVFQREKQPELRKRKMADGELELLVDTLPKRQKGGWLFSGVVYSYDYCVIVCFYMI